MLVIKYEARNFFNDYEYHEDVRTNPSFEDIKKAFRFLKKSYRNAIQIKNTTLVWDKIADFEHGILSAREYDENGNYKEFSWDYDECKKNYYAIYKNMS